MDALVSFVCTSHGSMFSSCDCFLLSVVANDLPRCFSRATSVRWMECTAPRPRDTRATCTPCSTPTSSRTCTTTTAAVTLNTDRSRDSSPTRTPATVWPPRARASTVCWVGGPLLITLLTGPTCGLRGQTSATPTPAGRDHKCPRTAR